jgi:hypothetical protein
MRDALLIGGFLAACLVLNELAIRLSVWWAGRHQRRLIKELQQIIADAGDDGSGSAPRC